MYFGLTSHRDATRLLPASSACSPIPAASPERSWRGAIWQHAGLAHLRPRQVKGLEGWAARQTQQDDVLVLEVSGNASRPGRGAVGQDDAAVHKGEGNREEEVGEPVNVQPQLEAPPRSALSVSRPSRPYEVLRLGRELPQNGARGQGPRRKRFRS